jgi:nicotinamide-nucleotide amidase
MNVSTLSIGDEVILGEIIDTNAAHIAGKLYDEGIIVKRHLCVGDNEDDIVAAIESLSGENRFVVVSGGLGPTSDDMTAKAAAKAAGKRLVLNDEALTHLQNFYTRVGREMLPGTEKQCMLPAKAKLIPNPTGTACGFILPHNATSFFFLPGVPAEMKRMLEQTVLPAITAEKPDDFFLGTRVFRVFGLSETQLQNRVEEIANVEKGLGIAYCVNFPEVFVKLRAVGEEKEYVNGILDEGSALLREKLGDFVFADGDEDTIDIVVWRLLKEKGLTLSLAESCTGGLIAKRITDMPGSSAYFAEGAVTYSNAAKTRVLGIPEAVIAEKGAVSSTVAMAMARGIRLRSGSDISVAVTGIAGPDGGTEAKPVGTVYIALADREGCKAKHYRFFGDRERIRSITAFTALDWLRRYLLSVPPRQ